MWNIFNCYLSGRHDYGMWCGQGAIFLRCVHCGKRSSGWTVEAKTPAPPMARPAARAATVTASSSTSSRVVPFGRAAAS